MSDIQLKKVLANTLVTPFTGLVAILTAVAFLTALGVVMVKDEYRQAYIADQQALRQAREIHTQWLQLLLEEGTWASNQRIEQIATQQMGMVLPTVQTTGIITLPLQQTSQTGTSHVSTS